MRQTLVNEMRENSFSFKESSSAATQDQAGDVVGLARGTNESIDLSHEVLKSVFSG